MKCDSSSAIILVIDACPAFHRCVSLVHLIHDLTTRNWTTKITHGLREGNGVADWLSNYSHSVPMLESPPAGCGSLSVA